MAYWYYERNEAQIGPIEETDFLQKIASGEVRRETRVWKEGMPDWAEAGSLMFLRDRFAYGVPPPLHDVYSVPPAPVRGPATAHVENHMVKAVLSTVFCCLPIGIAAIVNAAQVNRELSLGNAQEAKRFADRANFWIKWNLRIGLGVIAFYLLIFIIVAITENF